MTAARAEQSETITDPVMADDGTRSPSRDRRVYIAEASALPLLTVALIAFFSFLPATTASFPTVQNLQITLGTQAVLVVVTMAALIPLMAGEYDFSVGANAGMGAIFAASAMSSGHSILVALLVAAGIGAIVGVVNGALVTMAKVNSVVTTLGTATLISGVVGWKSGGQSVVQGIPSSLTDFLSGQIVGIPRSFLLALAVTVLVYYLLRHTPFGRYLDAIGVNQPAARLLGVKIDRQVLVSFLVSGIMAGAAGVLVIGQNGSASPAVGPGFTLPAIAAAFLSVAAIVPGRFNVWGSLVAILFLAALNSGLTLAGASTYINDFANGGALIAGVALASLLGKRRIGTQ
jgi:ribose transport system permease protein